MMVEHFFSERGIYYRKNEFQPNRKTLVLIHGVSGSSSAWIPYEKKFQKKFNILSLDLRGHGKSEKFGKYADYEINKFNEDVYLLVNSLGIKNFILVSHSFGAFIAFEFLNKYMNLVSASIFLSPNFSVKMGFLSTIIRFLLWPIPILDIFPFHSKKGKHIDYSEYINTGDWNLKRTFADVSNTFLRVYLYCLRQTYEVDYESMLMKIKVPTLIVHGKKDSIFPSINSVTMSQRIQGSKLVMIDNADHIVVLNNFTEVSEAIESFVDNLNMTRV
jgi:pimeloyl-ACP methyl ester carboxylesterase